MTMAKTFPVLKITSTNHSSYVDDCLAGADTHQEASELQQQLRSLLLKGGFNLRKWRASSTAVMESIPQELHESSQVKGITMETSKDLPKALGIHWDSTNDSLYVSVGTISVTRFTRKDKLSRTLQGHLMS